ncbi:hypothetical protein [Streptomyces anulatus]|uniref:hypothetical protein n=1 Tax=Streptomyces anulatus TaxID=1892 RepID=UPI003661FB74
MNGTPERLPEATAAVRSGEVRMLAGTAGTEQPDAYRALRSMVHSLRDGHGDSA